jgi:HAE1 family hydrophobic/amphiphilic exporter-1
MATTDLKTRAAAVRKTPFGLFFRHPHLLILALFAIIAAGWYGVTSMPLESAPELKIPIGIVTTVYPGASPTDVEQLVTEKLEEPLQSLDDLDTISSISAEGVSTIIVEFDASADIDDSLDELRKEVDSAQSELPNGAQDSNVVEVRPADEAIITISLAGNYAPDDFKRYADELEGELESITGVSKVVINGLERKEMQVLVNIQALEGFDLTITDISNAIGAEHLDVPIGSLRTDGFRYQASWRGQFDNADELQRLVVASKGGQNIYLNDVADVREVFAASSSETKLYRSTTGESTNTVTLQVFKKLGADLVEIADEVKRTATLFKSNSMPPASELLFTNDLSQLIRDDIRTLLVSALQTIALIGLVLFLTVGRKEATVAALSMPILYLMAFIALNYLGSTFNFLVLFALIISLGVVVDNAIVIVEGIYDNQKKHHLTPNEAALASVALYRGPLLSGTLTTIAAFLPLALMTGIIGQYVGHIPKTINVTLVASLISALFIVPAVAAWLLNRGSNLRSRAPYLEQYIDRLKQWYIVKLRAILPSRKRRFKWIGGMVLALIASFLLPIVGLLKVELFPGEEADSFFISIEAPAGTALENTKVIATEVEDMLVGLADIDYYIAAYGADAVGGGGGDLVSIGGAGSNVANITVELLDQSQRMQSSTVTVSELKTKVKAITAAEVFISEPVNGPPVGAPVDLRITGDNLSDIERFAKVIQRELEQIEGAIDVQNNIEPSTGDFEVTPKRDRLAYFGISSQQIAQILRTAVFGNDSIDIIRSGEETPIVIRLDFRSQDCISDTVTQLLEKRDAKTICKLEPQTVSQLENLKIVTPRGEIALSELVDITLKPAVTSISHEDGDTVVGVTANVVEGMVPNDVIAKLQSRIDELTIPEGMKVLFGGEAEDQAESFASLFRAMILAVVLIFMILVYQFGSFKQVFIIMFTIPLALIGVFFGVFLLGKNLTFPGMIGLAALAGIVVNDAIVLIDKINSNKESGMSVLESVLDGAHERLQPIIITTLTTSLGMLPLIFTGDLFSDLAVTVSVGIIFATLLTLVMVPVFYVMFIKDDATEATPTLPLSEIPA